MKITILAGGIGAAKFIEGIVNLESSVLSPKDVSVIVNVGDDNEMFGLYICPDIDIITYTVAGIVNPEKRWGIKNDSFNCLSMLDNYYGAKSWFNLGDKDMATHIYRTDLLSKGYNLTSVSFKIQERLKVKARIFPCTNDKLRTKIKSGNHLLEFEEYFVKERAKPKVDEIIFDGAQDARASKETISSLENADKIIIAPSNPYLSIDPILSIDEIKEILMNEREKVAFISPIVRGSAIKGPTAKIMKELGLAPSCLEIARHYKNMSTIAFIDRQDLELAPMIEKMGYKTFIHDKIMTSIEKKKALARFVIDTLESCS
ncbi:MAG: 2-phospho-L-lactate transferase [Promethearchaeota archaeon]